jgi:hypothetical protein
MVPSNAFNTVATTPTVTVPKPQTPLVLASEVLVTVIVHAHLSPGARYTAHGPVGTTTIVLQTIALHLILVQSSPVFFGPLQYMSSLFTLTCSEPPSAFSHLHQICTGLSDIGPTAAGSKVSYLRLSLTHTTLSNTDPLVHCRNLQTVDISHNRLTSLRSLGLLPHLASLDASCNKLTQV